MTRMSNYMPEACFSQAKQWQTKQIILLLMQRGNVIYNDLLRLYPRQQRIKFAEKKEQRAAGRLDGSEADGKRETTCP